MEEKWIIGKEEDGAIVLWNPNTMEEEYYPCLKEAVIRKEDGKSVYVEDYNNPNVKFWVMKEVFEEQIKR